MRAGIINPRDLVTGNETNRPARARYRPEINRMTQAIGQTSKSTQQSTTNNNGKPLDLVVIESLESVTIFQGEAASDTTYQWEFSEATFTTSAERPDHYDALAFRCRYFHETAVMPSAPTEEGLGGWQGFIEYVIDERGERVGWCE